MGLIFQPGTSNGSSIDAVYGPDSQLVRDFSEAGSTWNWIQTKLVDREQEVRDEFQNLPESVITQEFNWQFAGLLSFSAISDPDLFAALGRVDVSFDVAVEVHRFQLAVTSIELSGTVVDLFDFDHESVVSWLPSFDHPARTAAEVQAGYNTLGPGGRIYRNRLEFQLNDAYTYLEDSFRYDPPL